MSTDKSAYLRKSEKANSPIFQGGFALGIVVGMAFSAIALLGFEVVFQGRPSLEPSTWTSLVATLVAFSSAFLAWLALAEQRRVRQAGTDPVILCRLGKREDARVLSTLEVENVGAGAALDVEFRFKDDLAAFTPDRIITDFSKATFPIRAIPQGKAVSYNFGLGHRLLEDPIVPPLHVKVSYADIEGNRYESVQLVDVRELRGQRADDGLASRQTKATEKISRQLELVVGSNRPVSVIAQSLDDYRKEQAAILERLRQQANKDEE